MNDHETYFNSLKQSSLSWYFGKKYLMNLYKTYLISKRKVYLKF